MKLRDDILTSPLEVNLQSTDVTDEEQIFFLPDEEENWNKKFLQGKPSANNVPWANLKTIVNQSDRSDQDTTQLRILHGRNNRRKRTY